MPACRRQNISGTGSIIPPGLPLPKIGMRSQKAKEAQSGRFRCSLSGNWQSLEMTISLFFTGIISPSRQSAWGLRNIPSSLCANRSRRHQSRFFIRRPHPHPCRPGNGNLSGQASIGLTQANTASRCISSNLRTRYAEGTVPPKFQQMTHCQSRMPPCSLR